MNDEAKPDEVISGEIIDGDTSGEARSALDLKLELPPAPEGVSLGAALLHQYRYWGLARTLNAYRRAVESGVAAVNIQTEFYQASRLVAMEKGRWENREQYREAARMEADVLLENVKARKAESELELRRLQEQLAAVGMLEEIAKNNRAAELARAKRLRREEEQRLEELESGTPKKSNFKEHLAQLEQSRQDYEELMDVKKADIERYGGEENLPDWLATTYETFEEHLGFRV
ncbi:hypothetical protein [Roseovarius sp.]|uniref:hypothetical protein n=1 Tax=Roseovarius sp. TaxID=1486281 RepID=UPI0035689321